LADTTEVSLNLTVDTSYSIVGASGFKPVFVYATSGEALQQTSFYITVQKDGYYWLIAPKGYAFKSYIVRDSQGNVKEEHVFPEFGLRTAVKLGENPQSVTVEAVLLPAKAGASVGPDYDPSAQPASATFTYYTKFSALVGNTVLTYDLSSGNLTTSACQDIDLESGDVNVGDCLNQYKGKFADDTNRGIDIVGTLTVVRNDGNVEEVQLDATKPFTQYIKENFQAISQDGVFGNLWPVALSGSVARLRVVNYTIGDDGYPTEQALETPSSDALADAQVSNSVQPDLKYDDQTKTVTIRPDWYALVRDSNGKGPMLHVKWCYGSECIDENTQVTDEQGNQVPAVKPLEVLKLFEKMALHEMYDQTTEQKGYMFSATLNITIGSSQLATLDVKPTYDYQTASSNNLITASDTQVSTKYFRFEVDTSGTLVDTNVSVKEYDTSVAKPQSAGPLQYNTKYGTLLKLLDSATQEIYPVLPNQGVPTTDNQNKLLDNQYKYTDVNGEVDTTAYLVEPVPRSSDGSVYAQKIGDETTAYAFLVGKGLVYASNAVVKMANGVFTHPSVKTVKYSDLNITILGYDADPVQSAQQLSLDENNRLSLKATNGNTIATVAKKPTASSTFLSVAQDENGNNVVPLVVSLPVFAFADKTTAQVVMQNLENGEKSWTASFEATIGQDWAPQTSTVGSLTLITNSYKLVNSTRTVSALGEQIALSAKLSVGNNELNLPVVADAGTLSKYYEKVNDYTLKAKVSIAVSYKNDVVSVSVSAPILNGQVIYSTDTNVTHADKFSLEYSKQYYPCQLGDQKKYSKLTVTVPYWNTFTKTIEIPDPDFTADTTGITVKTYGWACSLSFSVQGTSMPIWPDLKTKEVKQTIKGSVGTDYSFKWLDVLEILPLGKFTVTMQETGKSATVEATVKQATQWPDAKFQYSLGYESDQIGCKQGDNVVDCCRCTASAYGYVLFPHKGITYAYLIGKPTVSFDFSDLLSSNGSPKLSYSLAPLWHSPAKIVVSLNYVDKVEVVTKSVAVADSGVIEIPNGVYKLDVVVLNKCNYPIYQTEFYNRGFIYSDMKYDYTRKIVSVDAIVVDDNAMVELIADLGSGYMVLDKNEGDKVAQLSGDYPVPSDAVKVVLVASGDHIGIRNLKEIVTNPTKLKIEKVKEYAVPLVAVSIALVGGWFLGTTILKKLSRE